MSEMLTQRLRLRPLVPGDAPAMAAYRSDPTVARYQAVVDALHRADAEMLIEELVDSSDPTAPGWFQYGVELLADGTVIGDLGVRLHENKMQAEIGFTIAAASAGQRLRPRGGAEECSTTCSPTLGCTRSRPNAMPGTAHPRTCSSGSASDRRACCAPTHS